MTNPFRDLQANVKPVFLDDATIAAIAAAIGAAPPTGGATSAKQDTGNTTLALIDGRVDGLEAAAASQLAKTPALGTAGTPSADVLTVQGSASGTPLPTVLGNPSTFWNGSGSINNSTVGVTLKTAPGAGVRLYVTGLQIRSQALSGFSELSLRDGASGATLWATFLDTTAAVIPIVFPTPLRLTANTLLEVGMNVAVTGYVYISAQGYTGA